MRFAPMIRWKLHEMMAAKRIRNKDLALALNLSESRVSIIRKQDTLPAIKPETLNGICKFLQCQPGDLLIYEDEPEDNESIGSNPNPIDSSETKLQVEATKTQDTRLNRSFLAVVVEVPKSA